MLTIQEGCGSRAKEKEEEEEEDEEGGEGGGTKDGKSGATKS